MLRWVYPVGVIACWAALSCSGEADEGGECSGEACGGDLVGNWQISEVCGTDAIVQGLSAGVESCEGASIDGSGFQFTGPVVFDAAGTFTMTLTLSGSIATTLPASCLLDETSGVQLTCEQLDTTLQQTVMTDPEVPFESVACAGSGGCTCNFELKPQTNVNTGTYVVNGGTVNMTTAGEAGEDSTFCVADSTMTLTSSPEMVNGRSVRLSMTLTK